MQLELEPGPELKLFGVYDAGVPNRERVILQATKPNLDLTYFGIVLAVKLSSGAAIPIADNFFWFGNGVINQGDWIILYTSVGVAASTENKKNPAQKIYNLYWGRKSVVFPMLDIVPLIFKFDSITIGNNPLPSRPAINR
jgi:hypothetical protein